MRVIVSEELGMCFGVRDALKIMETLGTPENITIHGELVHNEQVLIQLQFRGFHMVPENEREEIPRTPQVLVTAHGISDRERTRLQSAGKELIDTTCPLVHRAHQAAQKLQREGYHVLVIGKSDHVEVQGIVEDLTNYDVIRHPEEVRTYSQNRLGIMCQTTTPVKLVEEIRKAVAQKNPHAEVQFIDTVCHPTKDHQRALEKLLSEVNAVVVVGGKNSNNTRALVSRCREQKIPAFHVQGAEELQNEWFEGVDVVGLTAGTSTLDRTIEEVHQALLAM